MTDSMKFGPEWLRNLSGDSCNSGGSGGGTANLITPRYQLAEHRYGREEMLALFDRTCKPPEALASLQTLYVEKTQLPLAFIPMTEDETRVWSTGFSSSSSSTGIRGRGGSVDRGGRVRTGRGGGGMYSSHFSRGIGFDDTGDGGSSSSRLDSQSYQGRRIFDRSQSERGWSERNGVSADTGGGEWNGSTSPRKELTRGPSGSSLMENNWRRHRGVIAAGDGEDEGWRVASNNRGSEKWVRGNWRDGSGLCERDRMDRGDNDGEDNRGSSSSGGGGGGGGGGNNSGGRWETRTSHHRLSHESSSHHHPPRTARTWESNHHDNHDNLPEWATAENPSESGGSFDASGAFHGGGILSDEDEGEGIVSNTGASQEGSNRTRRISEGNNTTSSKTAGNKLGSYGQNTVVHNNSSLRSSNSSSSSGVTRERLKSLHPFDDDEKTRINHNRKSISPTKQHSVVLNSSALKMTDSTTTTVITATSAIRKVQTSASSTNLAKNESTKIQGPQRSKSFIDKPPPPPPPPTKSSAPLIDSSRSQESSAVVSMSKPKPIGLSNIVIPQSVPAAAAALLSSKPEDDLDRMNEEADMLVAKLTADEEGHREDVSTIAAATSITNHQSQQLSSTAAAAQQQEKWFYRDPQGEVQGPFLANEMAEWCRAGYFTPGLLVRRTCDERYTTLGDLMTRCGRVPFIPGPPIPPLKLTEQVISPSISNTAAAAVPTGLPPGSALPKPGIDDPLLAYQQYHQQLRLLHNQQVLLRQMKNSAITKLSQSSDHFATLSAVEQNQLIMQCVMQDPEIRELSLNQSPFVNSIGPTAAATTNPVMQLFNQMQQAKTQNENHLPSNPHPAAATAAIDPLQQFIQKIGSNQNLPVVPSQSSINPPPSQPSSHHHHQDDNNPIKSLLRQLYVNANGHPQSHQMDSIWPQPPSQQPPPPPPPQINAQFNAQNWLAQVGPLPHMPPPPGGGPPPNSLWDLQQAKEMKTEQQILEEQNIKMIQQQEEQRKKEEQLRRQEEQLLLRQVEDETAKRKLEAAAAAEHARQLEESKRKDEEKTRKEEEKRRKEEEKRKQEEEMKKKEEKKRKEDDRKREEKRKLDEENNRKKQEEEKKKREEAKRQEEKLKKEEDRRKKLEEEQQQKRQEEQERLNREEETRKKQEHAEEQAKRAAEQRRREAEALKKLQERSKAPWAQTQHAAAQSVTTHAAASLVDIQRLEREKKAEEIRHQQQLQQQLAQQKAIEAAREAAAVTTDSSKRLQFKWAEKAAPANTKPQVKSLAQIQQEEQERISKVKQQEKERQEKANQKEAAVVMQNAGIWGTASQSLSWAATSGQNSGSETKVNNKTWAASGFWDEPPPITIPQKNVRISKPQHVKSTPQPAPKAPAVTTGGGGASVVTQSQQQQQQNINNMKATKSRVKKEEAEQLVKKLFENNTANADDFTQWCYRTLCGLQSSVDIPTFIGFLRDIEAAYEVKEYVRMYLGDSKQTTEFTKQFLEKRSKLRSAQRPRAEADDLCKPAPAVNPNAPTEFQEVKGKSKKPKKGKMCKVDSRILGFSVTAATDRINVGDRDYGEGV